MNNMPVVNAAFSHKFDRLFRAYTQRQHIDLDEIYAHATSGLMKRFLQEEYVVSKSCPTVNV